jgi:2-amino-4-hydroxy-6-hydroxymethyldihydropteridine diphosphokinase
MVACYIGVGSNLGNRHKNILSAVRLINKLKGTKIIKKSRIIETLPLGGPANQPKFLNAAFKLITRLSPLQLLKKLKQIEKELGRKKTVRYGSRTIDLDILFYGDRVMKSKTLTIPHPRVFEREFVLKPLVELL